MNLSRVVQSPRRFSLRQSKFIPEKHTKTHFYFQPPWQISSYFVYTRVLCCFLNTFSWNCALNIDKLLQKRLLSFELHLPLNKSRNELRRRDLAFIPSDVFYVTGSVFFGRRWYKMADSWPSACSQGHNGVFHNVDATILKYSIYQPRKRRVLLVSGR